MIYLDHNATTPLREEVLDAMARVLRDGWGNPSSAHAVGAAARRALERAREQVAALVGARPGEVVFTSGATEANNAALAACLDGAPGGHHVATAVEHPSVLAPLAAWERRGAKVTRVEVDASGRVDPGALESALGPDTRGASVIWAHNETGVIQPVEALAQRLAARGVPLHLDATQALGKIPVDLAQVPARFLAGSAHKMNGPSGAGFLVVRDGLEPAPLLHGGPQERRRRGGTENVAGAVGLGVAAELARTELAERARRMRALRDRLAAGLRAAVPDARPHGDPESGLPNTLSVEIPGVAGDVLVEALDLEGVCVASGAACASGSVEPSHALLAMGCTPEAARASLRFSVGHGVDEAQVDRVLDLLPGLVARVRSAA